MSSLVASALRSVVGRSVLVTGGASGLGEATARFFAAQGAKVTIADLDATKGAALASTAGLTFARCDVTSEESVKAAIAAAIAAYGGLHGVVNCAGIAPPAKVLGKKGVHSLDQFQKVITINLVGSFNVIRLAAEEMAKNSVAGPNEDRGVIVNTASIAAFDGQIAQAAYSASKGGIVAMTLPIARELAAHGIRVNTIAPGIMGTPLLFGLPQAAQDSLSATVPFPKRLGNPAEFAALAHHIFTNQYFNGEVVRLDGALRMAPQ